MNWMICTSAIKMTTVKTITSVRFFRPLVCLAACALLGCADAHHVPPATQAAVSEQVDLYAAAYDGQGAISMQAAKDYAKLTGDNFYHALTLVRFGRFDEVLQVTTRPKNEITAALWDFAQGYAHLRQGEADFAVQTLPFIREGVELREPILVAVGESRTRLLQRELGADASHVQFAEMESLGRNPGRIIGAWHDFVSAHDPRVPTTLLGLGSGSGARAGEAGVASVVVMMSPNVLNVEPTNVHLSCLASAIADL